jgi:hypothetical protein
MTARLWHRVGFRHHDKKLLSFWSISWMQMGLAEEEAVWWRLQLPLQRRFERIYLSVKTPLRGQI